MNRANHMLRAGPAQLRVAPWRGETSSLFNEANTWHSLTTRSIWNELTGFFRLRPPTLAFYSQTGW